MTSRSVRGRDAFADVDDLGHDRKEGGTPGRGPSVGVRGDGGLEEVYGDRGVRVVHDRRHFPEEREDPFHGVSRTVLGTVATVKSV